jgi:GH15 family glucan-1,4-alpha-glucosidase
MSYKPIENYGIIADLHTVALVGIDGSIDWCCLPHFDSPSVFGAILDDEKGGYFKIGGLAPGHSRQLYLPDTNVLITRIFCEEGIAEEARLMFEKMLGYSNHVGLYAEEIGHTGEALGNFPQAFTHLGLISAAFNLDRVLRRGQ